MPPRGSGNRSSKTTSGGEERQGRIRRRRLVVSFIRWIVIFLFGYFVGTLQISHYCASWLTVNEPKQDDNELRLPFSPWHIVSSRYAMKMQKGVHGGDEVVVPGQNLGLGSFPLSQGQEQRHDFCRRMVSATGPTATTRIGGESNTIPSALSLWFQHYKNVHRASHLSTNDFNYRLHDFTADLLHLISPRLSKSTVALPQDWTIVRRILDKLEKRIQYLQQQKQNHNAESRSNDPSASAPEPVQIVVLGGSVLVGRNCRKLMKDFDLQFLLPNRECTYSFRLQVFLDLITHVLLHNPFNDNTDYAVPTSKEARDLTPQLFQVTKIAMGGTNTAVGSQIFRYDLLPEAARRPDIVINGYATNDMHILTILEMQASGRTLREGVFDMLQDFVRNILRVPDDSCQAHENNGNNQKDGDNGMSGDQPPLLIHLDDYLGNEQREIVQTMDLSQSVSVLAQYYGFSAISYANVVRDWVYGDTHEFWFSPEGWWPPGSKMEREIHPGMGAHIVTTWIIAYNMLHIASTYCTLEPYLDDMKDGKGDGATSLLDYETSLWASQLVPMKNDLKEAPGRPLRVPDGLPPKLTKDLSLEDVSEQWRSRAKRSQRQQTASTSSCGDKNQRRCPFSWVSGLSLQQNDLSWINDLFSVHTMPSSQKWKLVDEGGKVGFLASPSHADWVLEFRLQQPISTVTVFYLKSYGEKWMKSRAQVSICFAAAQSWAGADGWTPVASMELLGSHAKNTSEMYTQELSFREQTAAANQTIRVAFKLIGGITFKTMGLAICR